MTREDRSVAVAAACALTQTTVVVLKAAGVVTWPWLWVLAPVWIPFTAAFLMVLALCIAAIFD